MEIILHFVYNDKRTKNVNLIFELMFFKQVKYVIESEE